jgi:D-hydroxyproline dehydrogenase subunit alpha
VVETLTADVAVVGAGPAGIAAACRAAEGGARVVVLDEAPHTGGQIWRGPPASVPRTARRWIERFSLSRATLVSSAAVVDADGPDLLAERHGRPLAVRAARLVLATGARELFLPFPGWTLPNVLGVGAVQALAKAGATFRGLRAVLAGSGPLLLPAAAALSKVGARLSLVAEQASLDALMEFSASLLARPGKILEAIRYRASFTAPFRAGTWIVEARGAGRVEEVTLTNGAETLTLPCDLLAASFGLVPNTEFARHLGCALGKGAVLVNHAQETSVPGIFAAGEVCGIGGVDAALVEGEIAGLAAAGLSGTSLELMRLEPARARARRFAASLAEAFALRDDLRLLARPDTFVCRCEDVALSAFSPAWSARQAKLYTRAGMGPCQGRVCGPALAHLFGYAEDSVRPPLKPVLLGSLAEFSESR